MNRVRNITLAYPGPDPATADCGCPGFWMLGDMEWKWLSRLVRLPTWSFHVRHVCVAKGAKKK